MWEARMKIRDKSLKSENIARLEGAFDVMVSVAVPQGILPIEAEVQQTEKKREMNAQKKLMTREWTEEEKKANRIKLGKA